MLTLNFYTIEERVPFDGQEVILLKLTSSFGAEGYNAREGKIEILWHNGNGSFCSHNDDNDPRWEMVMVFDGDVLTKDNCYWCPVEEYYNQFGE